MSALPQLEEEIRTLVETFYTAVHKYRLKDLVPAKSCYEFLHFLNHMVQASGRKEETQSKELKKAKAHLTRCVLDFYKYTIINWLDKNNQPIKIYKLFLNARLSEHRNIGTDHLDTIATYDSILNIVEPLKSEIYIRSQRQLRMNPGSKFRNVFTIFSQLDCIYPILNNRRHATVLQRVLNCFCASNHIEDDLYHICSELELDIATEIIERYGFELAKQNPWFEGEEYRLLVDKIARKNEHYEAGKMIFNKIMRTFGEPLRGT